MPKGYLRYSCRLPIYKFTLPPPLLLLLLLLPLLLLLLLLLPLLLLLLLLLLGETVLTRNGNARCPMLK